MCGWGDLKFYFYNLSGKSSSNLIDYFRALDSETKDSVDCFDFKTFVPDVIFDQCNIPIMNMDRCSIKRFNGKHILPNVFCGRFDANRVCPAKGFAFVYNSYIFKVPFKRILIKTLGIISVILQNNKK